MEFFRKHKIKILMASPLLLALVFFGYSTISALFTIHSSKLLENYEPVNLEIGNYEIQQIDESTNSVKWSLKAKLAQADTAQTKAKVLEPNIVFYEADRPKFTIVSEYAFLDKAEQEINLHNDVKLKTSDGKFSVDSGSLRFREDSSNIDVADNWFLTSRSGYKVEGETGVINKNFSSIVSRGKSKLSKNSSSRPIKISANEITLKPETPNPVTAQGQAVLKIADNQTLTAAKILINDSGLIRANGNVNVKAENINCFSNDIVIEPNSDKSPKIAIFKGNPRILQNNNMIYADSISYDFATRQATIEGNVHSE